MIASYRGRILTILLVVCSVWQLAAQSDHIPSEAGGAHYHHDDDHTESGTPTQPLRQPTAWTLAWPLGQHIPAEVDTLPYNYQYRSIPSLASEAYATTGNLGAEGLNMIFMDRPERGEFIFSRALHHWTPDFARQKFYNVYVPTTLLQYNYGGNRQNHQDRLQAEFAGNVNRRIGIGAMTDYIYSKGSYNAQALKAFTFGFSGYYTGDRYEMQAFYYQTTSLNMENGGITDDLYITDPAQLQGGVASIQPKSIPVRLTAARNRLNMSQFYMNHAWKLGFWREEQVNDTLTRDVYVPVTRFLYSFDYRHYKHRFLNTNMIQGADFWGAAPYLNGAVTEDVSTLDQFTNTIGLQMVEGFNKWVPFGLTAYASFTNRRYRQPTAFAPYLPIDDSEEDEGDQVEGVTLTPWPEGVYISPEHKESSLHIGGRLEKTRGSILRYNADVDFALTGREAGDILLRGEIHTNVPLGRDTLAITAEGMFSNRAPSWLMQQYASNYFIWSNDFGKERRYRVGGRIDLARTGTSVRAAVENVQHMLYFGPDSRPLQHSGNVQVISVALDQRLRVGILNWNNRVTWQATTDASVLPLPALSIYSNLYLGFTAFKVLKLQIGVDCDYYTRYMGYDYQPATMTFHTQTETPVGNFAFCNLYANAKLYQTRFYILWSHINQGIFSGNYFSMPHYPLNPRMFQIGICIDFND